MTNGVTLERRSSEHKEKADREQPAINTPSGLASDLMTFLRVEMLLVIACVVAERFCKYVLHLGGKYTYPLLPKNQTFFDFILYTNKFQHFGNPSFFTTEPPLMYPAPSAVVYALFFRYHAHPMALFGVFIVGAFLIAGLMLFLELRRRRAQSIKAAGYIAASLLLAYPLWFELKQANIEIVVWVLLTLGVWAFFKGRSCSAAACFGLAGSMKLFPFVYLGLLIARRKYRAVAFSAVVALVTTLASLWLLGPNLRDAWRNTEAAVGTFRTMFVLHFRLDETGFDHSLFGFYKRLRHLPPSQIMSSHILTAYLAVAAVAGVTLYFLKIRNLPAINQVLCLCIAFILLPPVSYEYTLMHLYVPWALLVLLAQEQWKSRANIPGLTAAFVCLAILMAPLGEFIYNGERFGGQIKAVVLVILMYIGLKYPFTATESLRSEPDIQPTTMEC
jgi:hypothetical protein